ncbi:uncharacterized protein METZ01_LOCUS302298 [marine metagenome]|uniref:Uncharacterized protein n=1 Tax=marine metagenome TaxID=408172 RepID=A0A382MKF5_9ZZZZ
MMIQTIFKSIFSQPVKPSRYIITTTTIVGNRIGNYLK